MRHPISILGLPGRPVFRRSFLVCGLAAGLGLSLAGCGLLPSSPQLSRYDIRFEIDPGLARKSIQVDVVGPNVVNLPNWRMYGINEYWKDGNAMRSAAVKVTLPFGSGKPPVQVLSAKDSKWETWLSQGATSLVIIADLPGTFVDRSDDPRRIVLPLDRRVWGSEVREIRIKIEESQLSLLTPMAPSRSSIFSPTR